MTFIPFSELFGSAQADAAALSNSRGRATERDLRNAGLFVHGGVQAAEDAAQVAGFDDKAWHESVRLETGVITYAVPRLHWYKVRLAGGSQELPCCNALHTAAQPLSVRAQHVLPPRTFVMVAVSDQLDYGVILGVLPPLTTTNTVSDMLVQGGNTGVLRERYYNQFPHLFDHCGGQLDFNAHRAIDSTALGEVGFMGDLGSGLHLDPFLSYLRVDETAGLWLFYQDRLTRLAGHNFEERTAGTERAVRDHRGEVQVYQGTTPFTWEAFGKLQRSAQGVREVSVADALSKKPFGVLEPAHDDQAPFYRVEQYGGYLGQGGLRQVQLPPKYVELYRYSQKQSGIGVFQEQIGLDGSYRLLTAHSASFVKRLRIPVPKRVKLPEDPQGDTAESYKAAAAYGQGADHKLQSKVPPPEEYAGLFAAVALAEEQAYADWKTLHPFYYHEQEFARDSLKAEQDLRKQWVPPLSNLKTQQWLDPPQAKRLQVDHRNTEAAYYESEAGVYLLPDGGLVLRDGYGSEIRMTGGSIQISAPGDVLVQTGRNVITYAGSDLVLKAHDSVDVSASHHDVRIKAERHFEALAANSGQGRLLLDCKAAAGSHPADLGKQRGESVQQSGMIFTTPGEVNVLGGSVYIRTGGGDHQAGEITLDANKGQAPVVVNGQSISLYAQSLVTLGLGSPESPAPAYMFTQSAAILPTFTYIQDGLVVGNRGIVAQGNILGVNCIVATDLNENGLVYSTEKSAGQITSSIDRIRSSYNQSRQSIGEIYNTLVKTRRHEEGRSGSDGTIQATQFAPRTAEQMGTEEFALPEVYWQQLVRSKGRVWHEPVVSYNNAAMMMHPGYEAWTDTGKFLKPKYQLYDTEQAQPKELGEIYEDVETSAWEEDSTLVSAYVLP